MQTCQAFVYFRHMRQAVVLAVHHMKRIPFHNEKVHHNETNTFFFTVSVAYLKTTNTAHNSHQLHFPLLCPTCSVVEMKTNVLYL